MLYRISKEEKFDKAFLDEGVLGSLLGLLDEKYSIRDRKDNRVNKRRESKFNQSNNRSVEKPMVIFLPFDVLIYIAAIIKNVSQCRENVLWLGEKGGCIGTLTPFMNIIHSIKKEANAHLSHQQVAQILVQITAILRNLSMKKKNFKQFSEHKTVTSLCSLCVYFPTHSELMFNVSRILSKLSLEKFCRAQINATKVNFENNSKTRQNHSAKTSAAGLIQVLKLHQDHTGLVIRLCFILGNLTASNVDNRQLIAFDLNGKTENFERVIVSINNSNESGLNLLKEDSCNAEAVQEVLIKLIRLIANVSIDPEVAQYIGASNISMVFATLLKCSNTSEELLLNVVSAVTNLSFYTCDAHNKDIEIAKISICEILVTMLVHGNEEVVSESLRALANYARSVCVRDIVVERRGDEALIILLNHCHREIVYNACGVLINFAADANKRRNSTLEKLDVIGRLFEVLSSALEEDIGISTIATKALCNFAINNPCFFDEEHCLGLHAVLQPLLADDSNYFDISVTEEEIDTLLDAVHALLTHLPAIKK
eukprot:GSMAST32.ASY1.ANO1.1216.1 assembled CDS